MAAEGVAAGESAEGEPCAADGAVAGVGVECVLAAGGVEAALAAEEGAEGEAVEMNEEEEGGDGDAAEHQKE